MGEISKNQDILPVFKSANRDELLGLLDKATVTTGHWNGRHIQVAGFSGEMTFTEAANQIENHYQAIVEPMQLRQKQYLKDIVSPINPMPVSGKGGLFVNLALLPILGPIKMIADDIYFLKTPYPVVSVEEEAKIGAVLTWREQADQKLDSLFDKSQEKVNRMAKRGCCGKINQLWDSFLDDMSPWRNENYQDKKTFQTMVENRKLVQKSVS